MDSLLFIPKLLNHTETIATCAQPWSCRIICFKLYASSLVWDHISSMIFHIKQISCEAQHRDRPLCSPPSSLSLAYFSFSLTLSRHFHPRNHKSNLSLHHSSLFYTVTGSAAAAPAPWTPFCFRDKVDLEVSHGSEAWLPGLTPLPGGRQADSFALALSLISPCVLVCVWLKECCIVQLPMCFQVNCQRLWRHVGSVRNALFLICRSCANSQD